MNIHLETILLFVLLGTGYFFTLVLILAYEYKHIKNLKTNTFVLAKIIQTIAWFLLILRNGQSEYISIAFANSLLFISYTLEIIALLNLKKPLHKNLKIRLFIFTFISIVGFHFIFFFYNFENIRIAYYAVVNASIYSLAIFVILAKKQSLLMRLVGSLYVAYAIMSLFRGALSLFSISASGSLFTSSVYQLLFLLTIFIFSSLGSIGYILLQKEQVDKKLLHFASYDDLTGTLNRRTFTYEAQKYLKTYAKKQEYVSYLLFDIDNFKRINDCFGHQVGDQVLQNLVENVQLHLDSTDLFGRYGGDEFGIFLPGKTIKQSMEIAEKIQLSIASNATTSLPTAYTISIGITSIIPYPSLELDTLYTKCDHALYEAKRNGKNKIFRSENE